MSFRTIEWTDEGVRMIDQRKLPAVEEYPVFKNYEEVATAIRAMVIRGAPAIGVAAAMGIALGVRDSKAKNLAELRGDFKQITDTLASTRPTAVNLFWAIDRMKRLFREIATDGAEQRTIAERLIKEALAIQTEDIESNKRIGKFGQSLLPDSGTAMQAPWRRQGTEQRSVSSGQRWRTENGCECSPTKLGRSCKARA